MLMCPKQLRDIELMVQERLAQIQEPTEEEAAIEEGGVEENLLKQIQAVLYSTEEGFEVPEGQEVSLSFETSGHHLLNSALQAVVDEEEVF